MVTEGINSHQMTYIQTRYVWRCIPLPDRHPSSISFK